MAREAQDVPLYRYGHVIDTEWPRPRIWSISIIVSSVVASTVFIICASVDNGAWQHVRLREAEVTCGVDPPPGVCGDFERSISLLFGMYTAALPSACFKLIVAGIFVTAVEVVDPVAYYGRGELFGNRDTTLERMVVGMALWIVCAVVDLPIVVVTIYRYGLMDTASYETTVYPDSADETGITLVVFTVLSVIGAVTCTSLGCVRVATAISKTMPWRYDDEGKTTSELETMIPRHRRADSDTDKQS